MLMSNLFLKAAVRTWFTLTSRKQATARIQGLLRDYLALAEKISPETGAQAVTVPRMPGVDEDMRNWSFFMILEHNAIVNRSIAKVVEDLARGMEPTDEGKIDPKRDVMPSASPGIEQIKVFQDSVEDYLQRVSKLGPLRGTLTKRHPVFGMFDAHQWHCMLGFHLMIHRRQAEFVVKKVCGG
jgi:hypothetical protein